MRSKYSQFNIVKAPIPHTYWPRQCGGYERTVKVLRQFGKCNEYLLLSVVDQEIKVFK